MALNEVIDVQELRTQRLKTLLEGLPPDKVNDIMIKAGLIKGRTPRKNPIRAVTRTIIYRTIFKTTVCKHCGGRYEDAIDLFKDEEIMTITDEGRVEIHRGKSVKDGLRVMNYVNYCWDCQEFIKTLPRHELERRYIRMMRDFGMKMIGSITTVEKEEVKTNVAI